MFRVGLEHNSCTAHIMEFLVSGTVVVSEDFLVQLAALPSTGPELLRRLNSVVPGSAPGGLNALHQAFHATGDRCLYAHTVEWTGHAYRAIGQRLAAKQGRCCRG